MDFSYTGDLYDELRAAFGLGPDPVHDTHGARWLRLSPLPERWVRERAPASPTTRRFAMALYDAPAGTGLPSWFAELPERPLIYATIGTVVSIAPLIEWLIDGLSSLDAEVVITTGAGFDPARSSRCRRTYTSSGSSRSRCCWSTVIWSSRTPVSGRCSGRCATGSRWS